MSSPRAAPRVAATHAIGNGFSPGFLESLQPSATRSFSASSQSSGCCWLWGSCSTPLPGIHRLRTGLRCDGFGRTCAWPSRASNLWRVSLSPDAHWDGRRHAGASVGLSGLGTAAVRRIVIRGSRLTRGTPTAHCPECKLLRRCGEDWGANSAPRGSAAPGGRGPG